jgi:hypothetical protein
LGGTMDRGRSAETQRLSNLPGRHPCYIDRGIPVEFLGPGQRTYDDGVESGVPDEGDRDGHGILVVAGDGHSDQLALTVRFLEHS